MRNTDRDGNGHSWRDGLPKTFLIWLVGVLVPIIGILLIKQYQRIDEHITSAVSRDQRMMLLERDSTNHARQIRALRRDQIIYQMWFARSRKDTVYLEFLSTKLNELDQEKE